MSSAVQLHQPSAVGTPENSDTMSRSDVTLHDAGKSGFAAHSPVLAKDADDDADHNETDDKEASPQSKPWWSFLLCCYATKKVPANKPNAAGKADQPRYTDESKTSDGKANAESGKTAIPMQPARQSQSAPTAAAAAPPSDTKTGGSSADAAAALVTQVSSTSATSTAAIGVIAPPFSPLRPPPAKCLLPPLTEAERHKKTLVLDLDETLVHSSFKPIPNADFVISIELENVIHRVFVLKRPGVDAFLRAVGQKFEVVVFTASLAKYADPLLDILDRNKVVKTRLFREACVHHYGNYVKDLSHLGRRLEDTIIIDNSPFSYMFQPDNAIPITSWFNDKNDRQLYDLLPFLESIVNVDDVCTVLHRRKAMQLAQGAAMT